MSARPNDAPFNIHVFLGEDADRKEELALKVLRRLKLNQYAYDDAKLNYMVEQLDTIAGHQKTMGDQFAHKAGPAAIEARKDAARYNLEIAVGLEAGRLALRSQSDARRFTL